MLTPADLLAASWAAETISSIYLQIGIGGSQNWYHSCHSYMLYQLNYAKSASDYLSILIIFRNKLYKNGNVVNFVY